MRDMSLLVWRRNRISDNTMTSCCVHCERDSAVFKLAFNILLFHSIYILCFSFFYSFYWLVCSGPSDSYVSADCYGWRCFSLPILGST